MVLSHVLFNERSGTVIACPLTSRPQRVGYPFVWKVPSGRLPKESWAKISQVATLSVRRLGGRVGRLEEDEVDDIVGGLLELIG